MRKRESPLICSELSMGSQVYARAEESKEGHHGGLCRGADHYTHRQAYSSIIVKLEVLSQNS